MQQFLVCKCDRRPEELVRPHFGRGGRGKIVLRRVKSLMSPVPPLGKRIFIPFIYNLGFTALSHQNLSVIVSGTFKQHNVCSETKYSSIFLITQMTFVISIWHTPGNFKWLG